MGSVKEAAANANGDNKKFMKMLYDAAESMRKKDEEADSKKITTTKTKAMKVS
jgi:hypothetical protein